MNDINEETPIASNVISISDHLERVYGVKPCFLPDDWEPSDGNILPDRICKQTNSGWLREREAIQNQEDMNKPKTP